MMPARKERASSHGNGESDGEPKEVVAVEGDLHIGQVAKQVGLNPKTIRYYEAVGLIPAPKRSEAGHASPGYRLFTQAEVQRLEFIKRARVLDLSLPEIKELLSAAADGCCGSARPGLRVLLERKLREIDERIGELKSFRTSLSRLYREVDQLGDATCPPAVSVSQCVLGETSVLIGLEELLPSKSS
jgi:DNA-binding transcriptional MerR regulator